MRKPIAFKEGTPSFRELGRRLGMSRETIYRIRSGVHKTSIGRAQALYPYLKECPCCERATDDMTASDRLMKIRKVAQVAKEAALNGKPICPQKFADMVHEFTGDL